MKAKAIPTFLTAAALGGALAACGVSAQAAESGWQEEFGVSKCKLQTSGRNGYFILEPGYQLVLDGNNTRLQVTVLDETRTIGGIATRIVEEREWKNGQLSEVAKNYFAICESTKDVFYFGEEVDYYKGGKVSGHDGSWLAEKGNRPGLMMAGAPRVKMRYYQEIAPGTAMDRAEIVSLTETCETPAGTFTHCLKVEETSPLEPTVVEYKYYAPAIGLVADGAARLVKHGSIIK